MKISRKVVLAIESKNGLQEFYRYLQEKYSERYTVEFFESTQVGGEDVLSFVEKINQPEKQEV